MTVISKKIKADELKVKRLMEPQDKMVTPYSLKLEDIANKEAKGYEQQGKESDQDLDHRNESASNFR